MTPTRRERWRAWAAALEAEVRALALAIRDPRVPRSARFVAVLVIAYALSPIDLIPDFIPVIGHLDDLLIVPLGVALVIRLIPAEVMAEHRAEAVRRRAEPRATSRLGAVLVVAAWVAAVIAVAFVASRCAER